MGHGDKGARGRGRRVRLGSSGGWDGHGGYSQFRGRYSQFIGTQSNSWRYSQRAQAIQSLQLPSK